MSERSELVFYTFRENIKSRRGNIFPKIGGMRVPKTFLLKSSFFETGKFAKSRLAKVAAVDVVDKFP